MTTSWIDEAQVLVDGILSDWAIRDEYPILALKPEYKAKPMTLSEFLNKIDEGGWYSRDDLIDALRDANRQLGDLLSAQGQHAFVQLSDVQDNGLAAWIPKAKHPLYDED